MRAHGRVELAEDRGQLRCQAQEQSHQQKNLGAVLPFFGESSPGCGLSITQIPLLNICRTLPRPPFCSVLDIVVRVAMQLFSHDLQHQQVLPGRSKSLTGGAWVKTASPQCLSAYHETRILSGLDRIQIVVI